MLSSGSLRASYKNSKVMKGQLPVLLHVENRTSMVASVESRVPLLDHRIVEFINAIDQSRGKRICA